MIGNKGSMIDMFFFLVIFLVLGIGFLVSVHILGEVTSGIEDVVGYDTAGNATRARFTDIKQAMGIFDFVFAFLFICLNIIPIYLSVQVSNHPIFFVINIVLFIIYLLLTPAISNAMLQIWSDPALSPYSAGGTGYQTFPIMTRIFQYLPLLSFAMAFILSIAMFGKGQGGG